MKPSKAQRWWDWTWLQQLAPSNFIKIDTFNSQTMGTGRTRYTSRELQTKRAIANHHTSALLP